MKNSLPIQTACSWKQGQGCGWTVIYPTQGTQSITSEARKRIHGYPGRSERDLLVRCLTPMNCIETDKVFRTLYQQKCCQPGLKGTETELNEDQLTPWAESQVGTELPGLKGPSIGLKERACPRPEDRALSNRGLFPGLEV